ncbi:hypothetical protein V499_04548 [Pseudogymnoascus sp. VKM F-103]|nr:hypothetical protein V499_04548 [Pseudogymnoascus sp. VKM F-103]
MLDLSSDIQKSLDFSLNRIFPRKPTFLTYPSATLLPSHIDDEVPGTSTKHWLTMSNNQEYDGDATEHATYESDNDDNNYQPTPAQPQKSLQRQQQQQQVPNGAPANNQLTRDQIRENMGYRAPVIRESRIKDRPPKKDEKDSAVKIKIELDLEVEVDLYARVKGDVTIGCILDTHRSENLDSIITLPVILICSGILDSIISSCHSALGNFSMAPSTTSKDAESDNRTIVDYVPFQKWKPTDYSDGKQQISDSFAMAMVFHWKNGGYPAGKGKQHKLIDIAPGFFVSSGFVRYLGHGHGHGIVYEGCWVTYHDIVMRGNSKLDLRPGTSFIMLCEDETFKRWFTEVLNGAFSKYDFDTLSFDDLVSLTSPNKPDSLASKILAGLEASAISSINNASNTTPDDNGSSQDQTTTHDADLSTTTALPNEPAVSLSEDHPASEGTAASKEKNATRPQHDLQAADHAAAKPSTPAQVSSNATTSTKRNADSASMSPSHKPKKPRSQSAGYAAKEQSATALSSSNGPQGTEYEDLLRQNERLAEKNIGLVRQDERSAREIERLKMELDAATKAIEASAKIEALTRENQKLRDKNATLQRDMVGEGYYLRHCQIKYEDDDGECDMYT